MKIQTRRRKSLLCLAVAALAAMVYFNNASWIARPKESHVTVLAHRGVHQTYNCPGLDYYTGCSAVCIGTPSHDYLENTIPSMRAAFDLGADVVELDIKPTTDGELAVFHDHRLECRTDGTGVTRERSMAYLRTLDIGYGYTADGGKTFPFRGRAIGLMPTLTEVLEAFPDRRFLIHLKSNDPADAGLLARALLARPAAQRAGLMIYGGDRPVDRVLALVPELRGLTRASIMSCAVRYAVIGWSGYVPGVCRNAILVLPENRARYLWGWPHLFIARMHSVGTDVFVVGSDSATAFGIDTAEDFARVTGDNYSGGVWTDHIEVIGPLVPTSMVKSKSGQTRSVQNRPTGVGPRQG